MNELAKALFSVLQRSMQSNARQLASEVRALVGPEKLSIEQHRQLEAVMSKGLEGFTWSLLSKFDNIGGSLPGGILGYRIVAQPCVDGEYEDYEEIEELPEVDIREGNDDYATMWWSYLRGKS